MVWRVVANGEISSPDDVLLVVGVVSLLVGGVNDELEVRPAKKSSDTVACT